MLYTTTYHPSNVSVTTESRAFESLRIYALRRIFGLMVNFIIMHRHILLSQVIYILKIDRKG